MSKVIRNQLSRIKADEALPFQARLIFEAQVDPNEENLAKLK